MSFKDAALGGHPVDEISGLIATLHETQQRIFELTGGAVDAVLHPSGASYLLKDAQGELRHKERAQRRFAAELSAILDALPAHIALLNSQGIISVVNEAWRRFARANFFQGSNCAVGQNYLDICEAAHGDCSEGARQVAAGIRSVLSGSTRDFAIEYPCHSPDEQRWFRLLVSPLHEDQSGGCVVMHINVTERTTAENALRQQASFLRISAQAARIGSWLFPLSSPNVIWSEEVCAIHEMPPGSRPTLEESLSYYAPEWQDKIRKAFFACVREGTRFDEEVQIIAGNGNLLWIRAIGEAVRDTRGRIVQVQGAIQDISRRRVAEEVLRESEARFRQLAEKIADVFYITSPTGDDIIYISPAYETIWARSYQELYSNPRQWVKYIHKQDRPKVLEALKNLSAGQYDAEFRILRPDGSERWISARSFPVRNEAGAIYRIVGTATDVTLRKRSQERIEQQAELLNEAQDAILVAGVDGIVQFWNSSAERIYGWTASEAVGQRVQDMLYKNLPDGEKAVAAIEEYLRVASETGRWNGRLKQCKKNGSTFTVGCTFSVLRDDHGKPRAFLGINTDITELIALEDQYRQLQRLESVGKLTGGIAHDFNNLLTVILGNAELLVESLQENPQLLSQAKMTMAAAERGAQLVSRLLAFARQQPLDPQATDIGKLISGLKEMLQSTLGSQSAIQVVCEGGLWDAFVDVPQLENALLNLCINARDAMPEGGKLTIEATNIDVDEDYADQSAQMARGPYIMIAVSDTGVGMPPEVLARAFDPFFTTKDEGKGSGLGLSMVFGFIKQSMGHVKIYSEVGRGTTVRLYLPKATTVVDTFNSRLDDTSIPVGTEKVLYVEDDEQLSKHVTAQLKSLGYRVENAANGLAAIDALERANDFDLLFTDVMMPGGMNGLQLADRARELQPSLAVLFTTGFTERAIVRQARFDPGSQILQKPFRIGDLARKIRQVFNATAPLIEPPRSNEP